MLKKVLLGIVGFLAVIIFGFVLFVQTSWNKTYDVQYPDLIVRTDSATIAHGQYLVHGPAHCIGCHVGSVEEIIRAGKGENVALQGGISFVLGPLGTIYPANLTPDTETGIGRYSDGEIFRMMRHAVKPNGMATLTPMMPFWNMADEDLIAVVSYLRSLDPVHNVVPEPKWSFLGKVVRVMAPTFKPVFEPEAAIRAPALAPTAERGEYLARYVANCVGCHTPRDQMTFEAIGPEFSGGMEFEPLAELSKALNVDPNIWTRSTNLTPHASGVLGKFKSQDDWIERFRQGRIIPNSPMDWGAFSKMTDDDLGALWIFLNTLDPVDHDVGDVSFKKEDS